MLTLETITRWHPKGAVDLAAAGKTYATCEHCGRTGVRYLYTVVHALHGRKLVGSECARHLCHGFDPKREEDKLKAQWRRRSALLTKRWGTSQSGGNPTITFMHNGNRVRVTVFSAKRGGYRYSIARDRSVDFSDERYPSIDVAKTAAIDRMASESGW